MKAQVKMGIHPDYAEAIYTSQWSPEVLKRTKNKMKDKLQAATKKEIARKHSGR